MESTFLFSLVGLSIFGAKFLVKSASGTVRFSVFLGTGILAGVILVLAAGPPWPPSVQIPAGGVPVITGLAGILLYVAEKRSILTRPGLQYIATLLLGLLLAGLSYGIFLIYQSIAQLEYRSPQEKTAVILIFVLIGFLSIFGYTFPERWFNQRRSHEENKTH